ncbi:MAG TPA: copper resistance protein CopC [Capillimicrobium sp.]|nr:copper resistance protein CopC [Capillimicrobium sp.]
MTRRLLVVAAALAAVVLAAPAAASAHAQLEGVAPARGEVVERQPAHVEFRFDEPVEGRFGSVRVFDAAGDRVDAGDAFHPGDARERIAVGLRPSLPDGTYTATYRVLSTDGHVVSGGSTFSIGEASGAGATVAELLEGTDAGPVTQVALGVGKGVVFAAIAALVGGLGFLLWSWPPAAAATTPGPAATAAFRRRVRALLVGAGAAGALGAAAVVVLEGAVAAGVSGWDALDPDIVSETLGTRVGLVWGASVAVWLAAAALAAAGPLVAPLAAAAVALALVPGLGGHAASQDPTWLLLPANALHVAAMGLWAGGLLVLLAALPAATRSLDPDRRAPLLAAALTRFSPLALAAVAVLTVAGVVQAVVEVRTLAHLLDTAFGRAVLVKTVLLGALVGIGAWHRRASLPRLQAIAAARERPAAAGIAVRRALRAEVVLIVAVLGVTAALSSYPPSTARTAGPVSETTTVGPAQLQVTVDPATVGANEIHLYLLNPTDGSQWDEAEEVRLRAVQPERDIGPIDVELSKAGPGHYVTTAGALLGVPGDWTLDVAVRVSDFDQYEQRIEVPIA